MLSRSSIVTTAAILATLCYCLPLIGIADVQVADPSVASESAAGKSATKEPSAADTGDSDQTQLERVIKDISSLAEKLFQQRSDQRKLTQSIKDTDLAIGDIARQLRSLLVEQQQLEQHIASLRKTQQQLQTQLQSQQQLIGEQLKTVYQHGEQNQLQQLLSHTDPAEWDRQLTYLGYINEARAKIIANYRSDLAKHTALQAEIETQNQQLNSTMQLLSQQRFALDELQKQRKQQQQQWEQQIQSDEQRIAILKKDRDALQALIDNIEPLSNTDQPNSTQRSPDSGKVADAVVDNTPATSNTTRETRHESQQSDEKPTAASSTAFASAKGKLPWPVKGKHRYRYGSKRKHSESQWQGETIVAKSGTEVKAIHAGQVIFADWFKGQGLLIIVDHGDGYMSLYAHNQSLLYDIGAWVQGNETIATVGNSGGQPLTALYFEIRHQGIPANP